MATIPTKRIPLHEAIAELIPGASSDQLVTIGTLLMRGIIPNEHYKLAGAWEARCEELSFGNPREPDPVVESLLAHKRELEVENEKKNLRHPFHFDDGHASR